MPRSMLQGLAMYSFGEQARQSIVGESEGASVEEVGLVEGAAVWIGSQVGELFPRLVMPGGQVTHLASLVRVHAWSTKEPGPHTVQLSQRSHTPSVPREYCWSEQALQHEVCRVRVHS